MGQERARSARRRDHDGTVYTWGSNAYGQLGDGTHAARTPAVVPGVANVIEVMAGSHTWGDGRDGQLGDGSTTSSGRTTPGIVPGLTADAVAMGRDFAFAIVPAG